MEVTLKVDLEDVKAMIAAIEEKETEDPRERSLLAYLRLRLAVIHAESRPVSIS